jgi:hypothetical protein
MPARPAPHGEAVASIPPEPAPNDQGFGTIASLKLPPPAMPVTPDKPAGFW